MPEPLTPPYETPIDSQALRDAMRRVPMPVAVVTAAAEGHARGMTIGSLCSTSLAPPLVSFNVAESAVMHPVVTRAEHLAIHLLREDQAALSTHFAIPALPEDAQFAGVAHRVDAHGVPILDDVPLVLHCRRYAVYPAGDHALILAEIVGVRHGEGAPLLYVDQAYGRFERGDDA